ncbi:hypothetical protein IV454_11165 [Massilia antarctica]|uniref:Uncharacterized protein n=1 Tax=Massilia antarctica TaxID=2765360 RepID=A0AA48WI35_9BURK|nr:hypothetical protein [Massilia antarctica]QPI52004.1 hypothetical protein IV454_11165 [Massilia antarctica]
MSTCPVVATAVTCAMTDVRPLAEVNTLHLKPGVLPSDLAFDMSITTMFINIIGTSDQFRAEGFA